MPRHSLHALLEDRVPPGLADDQVGPLDDDDADEEGCVAGELHDLPLLVGLQADGSRKNVLAPIRKNDFMGILAPIPLLTHCWP